ncbi:MAG: hypothetical protein KAW09_09770 [Thermoplasmata archaeon]|nr:hypothetical protein [Thermoplasmata archaeon]
MEDPDLAHKETTHSSRVRAGIARAKARGQRWGRPSVTGKKGNPDLAVEVLQLRAQDLSWSETAKRLEVSESTARRLLSSLRGDCESQNGYIVRKTISKTHVSDTCQKDHHDKGIHCTIDRKPLIVDDSETLEITEAIAERRGEFIRAALQLVLENEHLMKQVLRRIGTSQNVQKH